MARPHIDLEIFPAYRKQVARPWLRRLMGRVLEMYSPDREWEVSLVIAGDDTVRLLNQKYRGLDETTDVLAFAFNHSGVFQGEGRAPPSGHDNGPFVTPPHTPEALGEVILSFPQAMRQAEEQGHSIEREVALLTVHGVLHLLGYDHVEADEGQKMKAREAEALCWAFPEAEPFSTPGHPKRSRRS